MSSRGLALSTTKVNTPNGVITVTHPEGATKEQILKFAQAQFRAENSLPVSQELDAQNPSTTLPEDRRQPFVQPRGLASSGLIGLAEGVASIATSIPASVAGGIGGGLSLASTGDPDLAADVVRNQSEALTFQPRTDQGKRTAEIISAPFQAISSGIDRASEFLGADNPVVQTAFRTLIEGGPAIFGLKGKPARLSSKSEIANTALDQGYKLPPSDVTGSTAASAVEGFAGIGKVRQNAAIHNMQINNRNANRALGRPDNAPLSIEDMKAYRHDQSAAYNVLNNSGTITPNIKFKRDLSSAVSSLRRASNDFSVLAKQETGVSQAIDMANGLRVQQFDASSVVPTTQIMRGLADQAFDNGQAGLGNAYRKMSRAIEDAAESHLSNVGGPDVVSQFRQARQNIAQSYSVQQALEGSNINIAKLRTQRRNDAPLSGELEFMARLAEEFPKSTKIVTEPSPTISLIDAAVGAGALSNDSLLLNSIGAATLGRPAIRAGSLSPVGQLAARPSSSVFPNLVPGAVASGVLSGQRPVRDQGRTIQEQLIDEVLQR